MFNGATSYTRPGPVEETLTITLEFHPDGTYSGLQSITDEDGDEMGPAQAAAVWQGLSREVRDEIESECWADAEDDGDQDAAADDARAL